MAASAIPLPQLPSVEFDAQLLRRLSRPGPRYTSSPSADRFNDAFGYRDYLRAVAFPVSFRDICMVFDRYLGADRVQRFSQTI